MTQMDFWRQFDLVRPGEDLAFPVTVIGCGGIGSPTAMALAKMGCVDVTLIDDDSVENHNLPNQIYRLGDIGTPKVAALTSILHDFSGVIAKPKGEKVTAGTALEGVVISGVDSMTARAEIWKAVKYKPAIQLYVDARMGAEVMRIYTIRPTNPEDVRAYEEMLYPDEKAQELPCTGRAIIYNVFAISSLVASQVKKHARGEEFPFEIIFDLATLTLIVN